MTASDDDPLVYLAHHLNQAPCGCMLMATTWDCPLSNHLFIRREGNMPKTGSAPVGRVFTGCS